jgi:MoxR-like ATPase
MLLGAKALAVLNGKPTPSANDVRQVAPLILQHRIIVNYAAIADDVTSADLVKDVLSGVREPAYSGS